MKYWVAGTNKDSKPHSFLFIFIFLESKEKQGKASKKKQFPKKKLSKPVKGRSSEKKKPNKKAGKRPHAADFFWSAFKTVY